MSAGSSPYPERVGRYELLLPIARGGMGVVHLGRAQAEFGFERDVAVKLVHAHLVSPELHRELIEEAKLAARIRHPNVVPVFDVGEAGGSVYLVMEYIEGDSLYGLLERMRKASGVDARIALRALSDALAGLHFAHELADEAGRPCDIVHRDVSPHNILVGVDGVSRLTDFGIAKARTRISHTATGLIKGKLAYLAPENAHGSPLDRRADVWSSGVIAWEILAKQPLFDTSNEAAALLEILTKPAPRLCDVDPTIASALDEAILRALEKEPRRRWPTAAAFARSLANACAAAGFELATHEEVAEAVTRLVGPSLSERRRRAREVLEERLRAQGASLATAGGPPPSLEGTSSTPSAPIALPWRRRTWTSRGAAVSALAIAAGVLAYWAISPDPPAAPIPPPKAAEQPSAPEPAAPLAAAPSAAAPTGESPAGSTEAPPPKASAESPPARRAPAGAKPPARPLKNPYGAPLPNPYKGTTE